VVAFVPKLSANLSHQQTPLALTYFESSGLVDGVRCSGSEFERSDLTSHLDMTHSQLTSLRELLTGSPGSPPQINLDPNLMIDVRVILLFLVHLGRGCI